MEDRFLIAFAANFVHIMARFLDLCLRDLDDLPVLLPDGLREIRELDIRTRDLAAELAKDEAQLLDDLKKAVKAREQAIRDEKERIAQENALLAAASAGEAGTPSDAPVPPKSPVAPVVRVPPPPIDEGYFTLRRDALLVRRTVLAELMEEHLRLSKALYGQLDAKLKHLNETVQAVDTSGGSVLEELGGAQPKKKGKVLSEEEAFELSIEQVMRDITDPNEPLYCKCKRISHGEMVACENGDCAIEWFHFFCVGLKGAVPDIWYCADCTQALGLDTKQEEAPAPACVVAEEAPQQQE